ncbi:MAG: hypothetical protein IT287_07110 [Bdellovibrionaceae bacterium]|nr:hypothetical protein [Pseudobdellovibrionaceae bacterium]
MFQGILFLVYSVSFAQMNLGFYAKDTNLVPIEVQAARSKIFKITLPYYITLKENDYDGILQAPKMPAITKEQTQKCKEQKKESCTVTFAEINGTAFLGKTPDTLWTNCHIVTSWMRFAGQEQIFTKSEQVRAFFLKQNMPMELKNSEGQSVWSSQDKAILRSFAAEVHFPNIESGCNAQDDMVKIQLSRSLSKEGLPWSKQVSSTLYMGGYPRPTESREPLGKGDSDGQNFYWTLGADLAKESDQGKLFFQQKPNIDLAIAGPFLETLLADGVEGMSGAPVLDQTGAVVGIYKGFVPLTSEQKDIPFVSLYLNTQGMRYLEILSGE